MRAVRAAGSRITKRSRRRRSSSANERTSTGRPPEPFGRKRWPRVARPLSTTTGPFAPPSAAWIANGTTAPSSRRTSQRIGTAEREGPAAVVEPRVPAHALREEKRAQDAGQESRQHLGGGAPLPPSSRRAGAARRASRGPWLPRPGPRRRRAFFFAKPCAAPVHFPAASFATLREGPQTGSSRSGWRAGTSARSTRRRGV